MVLGESDNLFVSRQVTFSRHYATFVLGIHLSEFSFQILWTSERVKFFCKMAKFLLVGYFHFWAKPFSFWAKPFSFWAKPFSFWAKRCGRNSLWAKLAITVYLFVGGEVTSLGGELVGGETSWWRDDRIPNYNVSPGLVS